MGFEKIEAKSLTDLFVQKIEGMILSGELTVGDQLPPVRELCTLMGVSRPVVTAGLIDPVRACISRTIAARAPWKPSMC